MNKQIDRMMHDNIELGNTTLYNINRIVTKINEIIDVLNELTAPVIGKGEEKCKTRVDLIIDAIRNIEIGYTEQDLIDAVEILKGTDNPKKNAEWGTRDKRL